MNPQIDRWKSEGDVALSLIILIPRKWWSFKQWKLLHNFMKEYRIWFTSTKELQ